MHGDVKPNTLLLDPALNRAVLIDFGIATHLPDRAPDGAQQSRGGTPGFSAPEQMLESEDWAPAHAFDVYGLGAVAYAMLVGRGPFEDVRFTGRLAAQCQMAFTPASKARPGLPSAVDRVLGQALASDPTARQRSASAFADALERALLSAGHEADLPQREPMTRGIAFAQLRRAVCDAEGEAFEAAIVNSLPIADRAEFGAAVVARDLYPSRLLRDYLRLVSDPSRLERTGRALGRAGLSGVIASLQLERAPYTLLRAIEPLLNRSHGWVRFRFTPVTSGKALVALSLPAGYAPEMCAVVGGLIRVVVDLSRRSVQVRQTRCAAHAYGACEFEVE